MTGARTERDGLGRPGPLRVERAVDRIGGIGPPVLHAADVLP